jgi:hypothetical protein
MQVSKQIGYCLLLHYLAYTDQTKISSFAPSQKASAKFTNLSENADTIILPTEENSNGQSTPLLTSSFFKYIFYFIHVYTASV